MTLCSIHNLTIGVFNAKNSYISVTKKRLNGIFGPILENNLIHKNQRNCIFKPTSTFEKKEGNNETTIFLLENNLIDFSPTVFRFNYFSDYIESSKTIKTSTYQVAQICNQPKSVVYQISSFFIENYLILLFKLFGYILLALVLLVYLKKLNLKLALSNYSKISNLNYNQLFNLSPKLALIFLFFNLFFFINLILLSNGIKTETTTIRTDEIIDSFEKFDKTSKIFAYYNSEKDLIIKAPVGSFLYKLYLKKILKEKKHVDINKFGELKMPKDGLASYFFFSNEHRIRAIFVEIGSLITKDQFAFLSESKIYYEYPECFYFRKNLEEKVKFKINKSNENMFESGIYSKNFEKLLDSIKSYLTIRIFGLINEIINEYSTTNSAFKIENYENLFLYYFVLLFIFIILFLITQN